MPSSTSSSDPAMSPDHLSRPLPQSSLGKAAVIGLLCCAGLLAYWEYYWRSEGFPPGYNNSESQWASERRRINRGEGHKTVLTGSSRTLFDLQLDVWEQRAGERPIQLALEGTSPLAVIEGLAEDEDFTGQLIVGVAPGLFFSGFEYRRNAIDRYTRESPSQWIGQRLSMLIEPHLAFYGFDFALFTALYRLPWPERADVPVYREVRMLARTDKDRNTRMITKLEEDVAYQKYAQEVWAQNFRSIDDMPEERLQQHLENREKQLQRAIAATKTLMTRGIEVIFIRHPSEGGFTLNDAGMMPRADTWDVLIRETGAIGLHFEDHEEMQGYTLPEWSHMTGKEADRYTAEIVALIQRARQERAGNR